MGISSIQCSKHSKLLAFLEISLLQGFVFLKTLVCITECVWHSFTGITWFSMQRASNVLRNIFVTNVLKHVYTSFAEMVNLPLNNITILCWSLLINNQCWSWIDLWGPKIQNCPRCQREWWAEHSLPHRHLSPKTSAKSKTWVTTGQEDNQKNLFPF